MCVSFSVLAELSLEKDEEEEDVVEGRRGDLKEDVQEGRTVFVRSEQQQQQQQQQQPQKRRQHQQKIK